MAARNILFIMADQLRRDCLSCYGATHIATPNLDRLAARGVRFTNAYAQGAVCGASRMSYYTGRYVTSHGACWNFVPLPAHNPTLGDHLRTLGLRVAVVGKTHGFADPRCAAAHAGDVGFEPYERDDGIWPGATVPDDNRYAQHLRDAGFAGSNPWHDWANSARDESGRVLSGWSMRWAHLPAALPAEHSETAYTTARAIEFIAACGEDPWCLHLSYIKPHWPYVAPAPYHALHKPEDVPAAMRSAWEREAPHPVMRGFQSLPASRSFSDDERRRHVAPAYLGLVKQLDDELGRLFGYLTDADLWQDTLVVFCSDHGDYLGDHWLGEKELFHDAVVAVPLIVVSPDPTARRGAVEDSLVEAIDLLPTFIDALGSEPPRHQLEGRSLVPLLHRQASEALREFAISEGDYAFRSLVREPLGRPVDGCRMFMVRSARWKYVHFEGLPAQLFDLQDDPWELQDRGRDPGCAGARAEHAGALFDWLRNRRIHPTIDERSIARWTDDEWQLGVRIGAW
jgi:arylsulfatase A-like enzyme